VRSAGGGGFSAAPRPPRSSPWGSSGQGRTGRFPPGGSARHRPRTPGSPRRRRSGRSVGSVPVPLNGYRPAARPHAATRHQHRQRGCAHERDLIREAGRKAGRVLHRPVRTFDSGNTAHVVLADGQTTRWRPSSPTPESAAHSTPPTDGGGDLDPDRNTCATDGSGTAEGSVTVRWR
jgi:hypothetical protein